MQEQQSTARRFHTSEIAHLEVYGRMMRAVCRMKNLSSTGAFLHLTNGEVVPQRGDLIKMTVHLHSLGRSRAVDAEVVWSRGLGFGICFLNKEQLLQRMFQRSTSLPQSI